MRTLSRLFILAVILVFLGGCATFQGLAKSLDKEFKVYFGGDYKSILVPDEFYDVDPDEVNPTPIGELTLALIWVNPNELTCGLIVYMWDFHIYGCFVQISEDEIKYWIYDSDGKPQAVTEDKFNAAMLIWEQEGPPIESEVKVIST